MADCRPDERARRAGCRRRPAGGPRRAHPGAPAGGGPHELRHDRLVRARVEDVSRAAGIGHGTFYAHFGNHTEILEALVRRHADALDAVVASTWSAAVPAPRQAPELRRAVHRVLTGFFDVSRRDSDIRELWLSVAPGAMVEQAVALPPRGEPAAPTAAERLVEGRTDLWVHGVLR